MSEENLALNQKNNKEKLRLQHDYYVKVLDEAERLDFETISGVSGLDDEITLLRVKIRSILVHDPDNIKLIMAATNMLAKLVKTRYSISKDQKKGLGEAIKNAIKDIGVPLGVAMITKKLSHD